MRRLLREMVQDYCSIDSLSLKVGLLLTEVGAIGFAILTIYAGIMKMEYSILDAIYAFVSAGMLLGSAALVWVTATNRTRMLREL